MFVLRPGYLRKSEMHSLNVFDVNKHQNKNRKKGEVKWLLWEITINNHELSISIEN